MIIVKPIKLSRTSIKYILGTGVSTHADQWKDDPKMHKGIPSELTAIPEPEIRKGEDADGNYSEIVVPEVFGPGSIMLFETDMQVSYSVMFAYIADLVGYLEGLR